MPLTLPRRCPQGLIDMDTGDPAGDIGFGLWELLMPMQCRPTPGGGMHHHGNNIDDHRATQAHASWV